jgi:hypothetical protein
VVLGLQATFRNQIQTSNQMKKVLLPLLFWALGASMAFSQAVSFTNQALLLGSISGSPYRDCAVDMNGDYLDDIVRVVAGAVYIDYQQPDGTFNSVMYPVPTDYPPNWSIVAADIDGNGFTDLLWGNGTRVTFVYFNDTGTAFTATVQPESIFSQRSTFFDIDNDGNLDAFVCHDVGTNRPYRNNNGTLSYDLSLMPTLPVGGNYAIVWVDYDNDGDGDLYITKCRGGAPAADPQRINLLYRNNGDGTFTEVGPAANMNDNNQSWTTVFEDFDNDGWMDAFTVNHSSSDATGGAANKFMKNNGDGTFTNIIATTGIPAGQLNAWNCDAADFNNDGFVDILTEFPFELYRNNGNGTFTGQDLPFNQGGIGDFNNDGFLDVIRGNSLWINSGNTNNWVKIYLEGVISNKNGIGARVEIYGAWGKQIRDIKAGRSFAPGSHLCAHFGLGQAQEIEQIIVRWPSGMVTTLDNATINTTHVLYELGCMLPQSTVTASGPTAICPGGSVQLSAPDGDSYLWSNGETTQTITVTNPGNYNVITWDADDCASVSNNVMITVFTEETPSITLIGPSIFCEGEAVQLQSTIAQSYQWSNGMTGQTITVSEGGNYHVNIESLCTGNGLMSNEITLTMLAAPNVPVSQNMTIGAPGSVILNATGNNLFWYATQTSTEPIGTGNSFETPIVTNQSSFWVESQVSYGGEPEDGGKPDNTGGGGVPSSGGVLFFNVNEPFTLESVKVYVPETSSAGLRTVEVKDANGMIIHSADFVLEVGEHVLDLNFEMPVGNGFTIGCPQNNLFRNSSGVSYPYSIGTVGSIYNSTFGASYYYYYYDWKIKKQSFTCVSERVEVTVTVVGINEMEKLGFRVYPNPVSGVLFVENMNGSGQTECTVFNALGETVFTKTINRIGRNELDLSGLASGFYSLRVKTSESEATTKIVVQ